MRVRLPYGTSGLEVTLPDRNVTIIESEQVEGVTDERQAVLSALRHPVGKPPLRRIARESDTVAIVFPDGTRAMPRERVLPLMLEELAHVPLERITLINALGTHRPNSEAELAAMLGEEISRKCRVVQHNCDDETELACVGVLSCGEPLHVNKAYASASIRILTGLIEPHFFSGFSGGPKAVLPGIAGRGNIMSSHAADLLCHPNATWGVTYGNPVFERMLEAALLARVDFVVNVSVNRRRQITGVFAGDLVGAHRRGVEFVRSHCTRRVDRRFDIVITTNGGYPLDQNLYQTVKAMSAAARVLREGGAMIVAAECRDGIPSHGEYGRILRMRRTPEELLRLISSPDFCMPDQWQVQIQAQIQVQKRARIFVKSDHLDDDELRSAKLIPCHDVEDTLSELLSEFGGEASIGVLVDGPETIPYVE